MSDTSSAAARFEEWAAAISASVEETTTAWHDLARRGLATAVEQIAGYFKDGWGVTEIEHDLPILTRDEIEAAIQYYLNHRAEIERDLRRSRELYEASAPKAVRSA